LFVIRVVLLLIVMFCVLFVCKCVLPPGVNPTAVDKYIDINNMPCLKNKLPDEGPSWLETRTRSFVKLVSNNSALSWFLTVNSCVTTQRVNNGV
jgi:hypothetical protein